MRQGYAPDFDLDLRHGLAGEAYVDGLRGETVEVKNDRLAAETGNVWIEYQCRGRDGIWRDSGIRTTRATVWVYLIGEGVGLVVPTEMLARAADRGMDEGRLSEETDGSNPTRGVKVPLTTLLAWLRGLVLEFRQAADIERSFDELPF